MSAASKFQLSIDFEPLLTEQYRSFLEVLNASVYGSRIGLSRVAAHCDVSPSQLTRMLNPEADDARNLPAALVPKIIEATGDLKPVLWLVAKFVPDDKTRQRLAVAQLASLMPSIQNALSLVQKEGK